MNFAKDAYLPAQLLLFSLFIMKRSTHSWFSPDVFFALVWTILIWLPLLVLPNLEVSASAIWFIFFCCFAFWAGSMAGSYIVIRFPKKKSEMASLELDQIRLYCIKALIIFCTILGLVAVLAHLDHTGRNLFSLFSPKDLISAAREYSVLRYHEGYSGSATARILLIPCFLGVLLSGMFAAKVTSHRWVVALPFIPVVYLTVLLTTKSTLLISVIMWFSSFICTRAAASNSKRSPLTKKERLVSILALAGMLLLLIPVQMARYGDWSVEGLTFVIHGSLLAALGYLTAFSMWFDSIELFSSWQLTGGAFTFSGAFDLLGIQSRAAGVYTEPVIIAGDYSTNIFTIYRGLIQDFGANGTVLTLFICGILTGLAYLLAKRGAWEFLPITIGFYTFTLWSNIISVFSYNSIIAAFLIFFLYLSSCKIVVKSVRRLDMGLYSSSKSFSATGTE